MRFFRLKLAAIDSLVGAWPRRERGQRPARIRRAAFESLSPRAMLSGHGLSGHMISAHSAALHITSSPAAQPAVVSSASHPSVAAVSSSPHAGSTTKIPGALLQSGSGYSGGPMMFSSAGTLSILASPSNYGGGTLQLTVGNNYTGETPVSGGTFNFVPGGTTIADIGTTNLGGGLNMSMGGTGTLTLSGSPIETYPGTITANGVAISLDTGATTTSGTTLGSGSTLVDGGTLRFNNSGSTSTIGTGVTATIGTGATLELAGTTTNLSNPSAAADRVHIVNLSPTSFTGTLNESGTVPILAGSDLTANHIIQNALIIGGPTATPSFVTIAAADPLGSSLAIGPTTLAESLLTGAAPAPAPIAVTSLTMAGDLPSDAV